MNHKNFTLMKINEFMIRWFSEFELGFDHPDADVNNFDPKIECENRKGNSVPLGSKCFIKCKPVSQNTTFFKNRFYFAIFLVNHNFKGFVFADIDGDTFATACTNSWDHDMEFGIFSSNW